MFENISKCETDACAMEATPVTDDLGLLVRDRVKDVNVSHGLIFKVFWSKDVILFAVF